MSFKLSKGKLLMTALWVIELCADTTWVGVMNNVQYSIALKNLLNI